MEKIDKHIADKPTESKNRIRLPGMKKDLLEVC